MNFRREQQERAAETERGKWFGSRCNATGIAIVLGRRNGLWVLDLDCHRHGQHGLRSLTGAGIELAFGPMTATPTGGGHHFSQFASEFPNRAIDLLAAVDYLAEGCYVLIAPSWHGNARAGYLYVTAVVRSGTDVKTVQTLARHSTPTLAMEVYAASADQRLRDAAEAAAERIAQVADGAACCAFVARPAAGTEGTRITTGPVRPCVDGVQMGGTGFEPVTSTV